MAQGMNCPVDGTPLVMSERQSIEIDYCPTCRGVWLDRGELDKIVERSAAGDVSRPARAERDNPAGHFAPSPGYHPGKRKKSFLEELFD